MKIKKSLNYLSIFLMLILLSCSYNFSEDNFIDIEIPSTNNNSIIFQDFNNNDTINTRTTLNYNIKTNSNQYVTSHEVYLDDEKISSNNNSNNHSFTLRPSNYEDGLHDIKIEYKFTSGSGSIDDQSGQEILTKIETFKFIVKRKPSFPPAITSAVIENGSITVKWVKADNTDYSNGFLNLRFKDFEKRIPLSDAAIDLNKYIDTSTILLKGPENSWKQDIYQYVEYSIIYASEYEELYGSPKRITFNPDWINLKISYINSDSYKITWEEFPLYNNVKEFTIGSENTRFNGSTSGGEQIINESYVFGKKYSASVSFENFSVYFLVDELKLVDTSFNYFDIDDNQIKEMLYNPSTEKYYAVVIRNNSSYIDEYSKDMELLKQHFITSDLPYNKYFAPSIFHLNPSNNNLHLETTNGSLEIDKNSLNIIQQYINTEKTGSLRTVLRNDILFTYDTSTYSLYLEVKNIKTNNIIFSGKLNAEPGTFLAYGGTLSNDGKYLYIPDYKESKGTLYNITNEKLEKIIDLERSAFVKFYDNKAMYEINNKIFLVDLDSKYTQSFQPLYTGTSSSYDSFSNKILLRKDGYAEIYDLNSKTSKTLQYEQTKDDRSNDVYHYVFLQNNRLMYSKGMYFDNY